MPITNKGKYRQYEIPELVEAARLARQEKKSINMASKQSGIPETTLKDFLKENEIDSRQVVKLGRPFALTAELAAQIFNYIKKMQELGFGLTVQTIRNDVSFSSVEKYCTLSFIPQPLILMVPGKITDRGDLKFKKMESTEDDWDCGMCGSSYYLDVKKKNSAMWVHCSYCLILYHVNCQASDAKEDIFMCNMCGNNEDTDDDSKED